MQAALGSDPKRELLSCVRIFNEDPHPTGFFEASHDCTATCYKAAPCIMPCASYQSDPLPAHIENF